MSGAALIALIRDFHKDCGGCPVEQLCDEYEAALAGNVVQLSAEQVEQVRDLLGRIIDPMGPMFSGDHLTYDFAYSLLHLFPDPEASS